MYYSIRHLTKFLYKNPVSESIMETRMHPPSTANFPYPKTGPSSSKRPRPYPSNHHR